MTYNRGDNLLILGDEEQGIAILKEKRFLEHLRLMERVCGTWNLANDHTLRKTPSLHRILRS